MNILILNGSPHPQGLTTTMVNKFIRDVKESQHHIGHIQVCHNKYQDASVAIIAKYQNPLLDYLKLKIWLFLLHLRSRKNH